MGPRVDASGQCADRISHRRRPTFRSAFEEVAMMIKRMTLLLDRAVRWRVCGVGAGEA